MKNKAALSHIAVSSMIAAFSASTVQAHGVPGEKVANWEKCAGIAKEGKNDCGVEGHHMCKGAKGDQWAGDKEWVYVPAGICEKIEGGKVIATKKAKKG